MSRIYTDHKDNIHMYGPMHTTNTYRIYCFYDNPRIIGPTHYTYKILSEACDKFIQLIRKHDPDNVVDLMKLTALKFKKDN